MSASSWTRCVLLLGAGGATIASAQARTASQDIDFGSNTASVSRNIHNLTDEIVFGPQNNVQPTEFHPSFPSQHDVVSRDYVAGARAKF